MKEKWFKVMRLEIGIHELDVLLYLDSDEDGHERLRYTSMAEDCFLGGIIAIDEREWIYHLIENPPIELIKKYMEKEMIDCEIDLNCIREMI